MRVQDVMTSNPACCTPDTTLQDVARMMAENDCGCVPVVENQKSMKPVGVITDRDIALRGVATGQDARSMTARDVMTTNVMTVRPEDSVADCCQVMEANQVRRVPVVDSSGSCCGMVAQADVAMHAQDMTPEMVREVSKPTQSANNVGRR